MHDTFCEHLWKRTAEPAQQCQAQTIDPNVIIFPELTRPLERPRIAFTALALDREDMDELATARSLSQLANTFLREKRFSDALPLVEEATAVDQSKLGATHPFIADDFYGLGLIYLETKRAPDAQKVLEAAVNLLNRGAGRGTLRLAYIQLALARAAHEQGRETESATLFAEAQRVLTAAEEEGRRREREI